MIDLLLFAGMPVIIGVVWLAWKYGFTQGHADRLETAGRRREDARDWQRRFGPDSPLTSSFFPPTQNEILETLCVLDHLTPSWETGEAALVEHSFLNELALNFPTLCKPGGGFPLDSSENPGTTEAAARREAFKARRAQFNALDQIISGPPAPVAISRGRSDGQPPVNSMQTVGSFWPALLGSAAVLAAVMLYGARFFFRPVNLKVTEHAVAEPSPPRGTEADVPAPVPSPASVPAVSEITPTPAPAPTSKVAGANPALPAPTAPSRGRELLNQQIAASKQRAVAKYPALAVEGSTSASSSGTIIWCSKTAPVCSIQIGLSNLSMNVPRPPG